ncbi:MAG: tRNA-intron lyase [Candidatus Woesearchaeota archaeon]
MSPRKTLKNVVRKKSTQQSSSARKSNTKKNKQITQVRAQKKQKKTSAHSKKIMQRNVKPLPQGKQPGIPARIIECEVHTECSQEARDLYEHNRYGALLEDGRVQLTLIEAYYLFEKEKITVFSRSTELTKETFLNMCLKREKGFWTRYVVYKDFRNRGYIIKTALKFGADFRVYEKGVKPGEDHARWIVYPVKETTASTWYEFAAKNRVAHSTKKRLLIGIVDEENSVTYYEVKWMRP